jgi:uncharacterized protein (DUF433 family)
VEDPKIKVDAKEVLNDIRSGMTDAALRQKYGLSTKGLTSMFDKLGALGLLHRLDAREVLRDLKSGMTDADLMSKYQLSEKALGNLFAEMERVHLLHELVGPDEKLDEIESKFQEIAEDMKSGLGKSEIMRKYRLTEQGVEWMSSVLACVNPVDGTNGNQDKALKQEELAVSSPEDVVPRINAPIRAHPQPVIYRDNFRNTPAVGREGLGIRAFFIGGMILWILVDLLYLGLLDPSSTEMKSFVVFGMGAAIAAITAGLYLGFRRWFSNRA